MLIVFSRNVVIVAIFAASWLIGLGDVVYLLRVGVDGDAHRDAASWPSASGAAGMTDPRP